MRVGVSGRETVKGGERTGKVKERERERGKTEMALPAQALSGLWLSEQCQETSAWKFLPSLQASVPAIRGLVLQTTDVIRPGGATTLARITQYNLQVMTFTLTPV